MPHCFADEVFCIIAYDNSYCGRKKNQKLCLFLMSPFLIFSFFPQHLSFGTVSDNKSLSDSLIVSASFQQTLWSVAPICSGGAIAQGKFLFFLLSKHVDKQNIYSFFICEKNLAECVVFKECSCFSERAQVLCLFARRVSVQHSYA